MNDARIASYWNTDKNNAVRCGLCPHRCLVREGASGICGIRENREGVLLAASYGMISSIALDPIEKKPLYMFHPGKSVLSIGSFGCNLRCGFCQNYEISAEYGDILRSARLMSPDDVVALAVETAKGGNIGVAYTYNEPLIGYEFLHDCAVLAHGAGLCNVLVTNGCINKEPLEDLLPLVDAMNIDLKGFRDDFYTKLGGSLETVKGTIAMSAGRCHVEVTTLVVPGENEGDVEELAKWLSSVSPDIPLHLTRFFPRYHYSGKAPTPRETIIKLCGVAEKYLRNVFSGNMG